MEWSLRAFASMRAVHMFIFVSNFEHERICKNFSEYEQASSRVIFASTSSEVQILRALLN